MYNELAIDTFQFRTSVVHINDTFHIPIETMEMAYVRFSVYLKETLQYDDCFVHRKLLDIRLCEFLPNVSVSQSSVQENGCLGVGLT